MGSKQIEMHDLTRKVASHSPNWRESQFRATYLNLAVVAASMSILPLCLDLQNPKLIQF